jgi:arsenical pump membrane protein
MSVLFSNLNITNLSSIYSSIIASNIAAFITPIGALAGIMWMSLLKTYNIDFSFKKFMKYGLIVGIPALLSALTCLFFTL